VRVVATGHSFSPVHLTDGTLIDLANLDGLIDVDAPRRRVRALPGTPSGRSAIRCGRQGWRRQPG
jgi:FAD/FMN-containing dehydrogenase